MTAREGRRKSRGWRRYTITLLFGGLFAALCVTLLVSKPPLTGVMERGQHAHTAVAWTFAYLGAAQVPHDTQHLLALMEQHPHVSFWAGSVNHAAQQDQAVTGAVPGLQQNEVGLQPVPRSFFPVFDGGGAGAADAQRFPHIPDGQLPGYGRTVYFVDYGEARFWFLNAARLAQEPSAQLDWLDRTAADNPQLHRIVLLQQEPAQPEVWDRLAASGADLVLIGARLYAPESAVTVRPEAGYRSSAHHGWAEWTMSGSQGGQPLMVHGQGSRLEASLPADSAGRDADRLVLDAAGLRQTAAVQEQAPVSIGAMWRYRAGGPDVRAEVPQGLDLTGETPARSQVPPSREDWRSPEYDDSGWHWARAPFGRSVDGTRSRNIRTPLPPQQQSPVYYFRKTFVLDQEATGAKEWLLHTAFEDGFVAYLNGVEIARDSIQAGLVDHRSLASPHDGGIFETISIANYRSLLVPGVNTLAVEVHTSHPDSPEMWFDMSLSYKK
ncbi:hypothetical protein CBW46_006820 [Paenibacillus xerothermodurans]|uniref:Uncharacterized protein n=2 Tax=Paenibacillus xerothermodurans TaxID=1977292 RepID=A0A2W1NWJ7_PAEXE|nr:hypothetical protein CBW46_006820 [Paenibacillus xerothermodurans]